MSNQEILQKAISKAIDKGWGDGRGWTWTKSEAGMKVAVEEMQSKKLYFNQDFAKALWGEPKQVNIGKRDAGGMRAFGQPQTLGWQDHLQNMVIADDAIEYLGEHLG